MFVPQQSVGDIIIIIIIMIMIIIIIIMCQRCLPAIRACRKNSSKCAAALERVQNITLVMQKVW